MAYVMMLGNITQTVNHDCQKEELLEKGYHVVSGSAEVSPSTALGVLPFYMDGATNDTNPSFRGIGMEGESGTLGALVKTATPGMEQADFDVSEPLMYSANTADAFTTFVSVAELPDEPDELIIYMLTAEATVNGSLQPAGTPFIYNDGHWIAYTPGDVFNPDYGAEYKLGLLAGYVDSQDFAALPIATANTKSAIEAILLAALQTVVNEGEAKAYTVSFVSSAYVTATGVWGGKFKVVKDDDADDNATDATARALLFGAFVNMKLVTDEAITTVPVGTADTKAGVEAAMLVLATAAVGEGYAVTVNATPTSTYDTGTNAWAGKLKVVETANATTNLFVDATARAITVVIAES